MASTILPVEGEIAMSRGRRGVRSSSAEMPSPPPKPLSRRPAAVKRATNVTAVRVVITDWQLPATVTTAALETKTTSPRVTRQDGSGEKASQPSPEKAASGTPSAVSRKTKAPESPASGQSRQLPTKTDRPSGRSFASFTWVRFQPLGKLFSSSIRPSSPKSGSSAPVARSRARAGRGRSGFGEGGSRSCIIPAAQVRPEASRRTSKIVPSPEASGKPNGAAFAAQAGSTVPSGRSSVIAQSSTYQTKPATRSLPPARGESAVAWSCHWVQSSMTLPPEKLGSRSPSAAQSGPDSHGRVQQARKQMPSARRRVMVRPPPRRTQTRPARRQPSSSRVPGR